MGSAKKILPLLVCLASLKSFANDTLRVSIRQADSLFLSKNYSLLAAAMNIDAQKAQILQSKLYPNPIFTADINAYDPQNDIPMHVGNTGQKAFQLEQLILLGGKRKAQIELAKTNAAIAEIEFQDLIRRLKFQLHSSLYNLNQQAFLISKYKKQLEMIEEILSAYDIQAQKGNIPLKDVVRLKGVYLSLNTERAGIYKDYFQELAKVQAILQTNLVIVTVSAHTDVDFSTKPITLEELNDAAIQNRPDYLISLQNKVLADQYFQFQKKNAVPDINIFTSYDQRGGAFNNQLNVGISLPLPVWNRNQGNIKTAQYQIKQSELNAEAQKIQILSEVQNYYNQHKQTVKEYKKTSALYTDAFEITLTGMTINFKKGNVGMLEFVDFFESYNDALAEIARVKIQLAISAEQLNLCTGKEIF